MSNYRLIKDYDGTYLSVPAGEESPPADEEVVEDQLREQEFFYYGA